MYRAKNRLNHAKKYLTAYRRYRPKETVGGAPRRPAIGASSKGLGTYGILSPDNQGFNDKTMNPTVGSSGFSEEVVDQKAYKRYLKNRNISASIGIQNFRAI